MFNIVMNFVVQGLRDYKVNIRFPRMIYTSLRMCVRSTEEKTQFTKTD